MSRGPRPRRKGKGKEAKDPDLVGSLLSTDSAPKPTDGTPTAHTHAQAPRSRFCARTQNKAPEPETTREKQQKKDAPLPSLTRDPLLNEHAAAAGRLLWLWSYSPPHAYRLRVNVM